MFILVLAAGVLACPFPIDRSTTISTRADLPAAVVRSFGDIAEKGQPFQVSDALPPGPHPPFSRFVSAQARGCELELHYEHGGRGHGWQTAHFHFESGHWVMISRR